MPPLRDFDPSAAAAVRAGAPGAEPSPDRFAKRRGENFPVASWLCPAPLRPAVRALYAFARTADDIADEGDASPAERQAALQAFRGDLLAVASGQPPSPRWSDVFQPLARVIARHALPLPWLLALLDAFEEDTRHAGYADRAGLLDYCSRSANPVGRLLLHLHGLHDARLAAQSDAVCSALQLINFWQDLSVDLPRGRDYVPRADAAAHRTTAPACLAAPTSAPAVALVRSLCEWAGELLREGAPIALAVPGRVGWELRFVVEGGARILEKIAAMNHSSFARRPRLQGLDHLLIARRALAMRPSPSTTARSA